MLESAMNKLTFEKTTLNTLSFILKVDGKRMIDARGTNEDEIPAWLCESGIPSFPPDDLKSDRVLVGVCGCGEYGCGNINARIERQAGRVRLFEFFGAYSPKNSFEFAEDDFDKVSLEIANLAKEQIALWKIEFKNKEK
jgi:hypothetical protein